MFAPVSQNKQNHKNERNKKMCTVSIDIDEAAIQQIDPGLTSRERIGQWLQHRVDMMLNEMVRDRSESRVQALKKDMTPEELYSLIAEEIDEIYANG